MPWTPIALRASLTSSSLNGLMMASTFFMTSSSYDAAVDERCRRALSSVGKPYVKEERFVKIRVIDARRRCSGLPPGAKQPTCRGCKTAGGWGFSTSRVVSFRALLPLWSSLLALESLLRSGHEPPDVLAVPEHDEKGHRGRCQHNGWRVAEHQDDDRRAERGEYRAQRDDPRERDRQ